MWSTFKYFLYILFVDITVKTTCAKSRKAASYCKWIKEEKISMLSNDYVANKHINIDPKAYYKWQYLVFSSLVPLKFSFKHNIFILEAVSFNSPILYPLPWCPQLIPKSYLSCLSNAHRGNHIPYEWQLNRQELTRNSYQEHLLS